MGRRRSLTGAIKFLPAEYPGDEALHGAQKHALPVLTLLDDSAQIPSVNPVSPLRATPSGGYVGPGARRGRLVAGLRPHPWARPVNTSALATSEGGNNSSVVNAQGYAGQFQFGTGRLADLGMYQPAAGE